MGSQPDHSTGRLAGLRHTRSSSDCHCRHRLPSRRLHRIRPAIIRGQLCYVIAGVAFTNFARAATAWAAVEADHVAVAELRELALATRSSVPAKLPPGMVSGGQVVS